MTFYHQKIATHDDLKLSELSGPGPEMFLGDLKLLYVLCTDVGCLVKRRQGLPSAKGCSCKLCMLGVA